MRDNKCDVLLPNFYARVGWATPDCIQMVVRMQGVMVFVEVNKHTFC